ncbi:MAG: phage major capsid protein [Verrucomicrobiota bacterium]
MKKRRSDIFTRTAPAVGEELRREFELDRAAVNEQARTVELSFSSEAEVERWFGMEIIDHTPQSVRLGRMRNGAALLVNHDRSDQVGVVESVTIGNDRRGRAVVRFGRSARANEIFQDVVDGIRRLVSVGYRVHRTETEKRAGGVEVVRVVDWEPYEISLVSIPADDSVGVGRGESSPAETSILHTQNNIMNREQILAALRAAGITYQDNASDDQLRALLPAHSATAPAATQQRSADPAPATPAVVVREAPPQQSAQDAVVAERQRVAGISAIADQVRTNGVTVDANRAIADGVTIEAFRGAALDAVIAQRSTSYQPGVSGDLGLSGGQQRDLSGFSLTRGLTSLIQGRPLDGLEGEMHQEAIRSAMRSGVTLEGNFHIPDIVLQSGRRDMTATGQTSTAGDQGGTFIATTQGPMIDLLYARMVLRDLGAQFLTGLVGNIDLPRFATGSTVGNKAENAAADESSPATDSISLTPHRATTFVELSQQLLIQSSPSVEALVRNDLMTALALLFEQRAIAGSGASNQPTGILNVAGIGSVAGGTNGAAPDWQDIVDLETAIATLNADIGSIAYLTNPKVRGKLKTTSKVSGQNGFVWAEGDTPLNGYRAGVTTQVPSNLTKGTASGVCSAILFGNFADLIIAQWGGISLLANPYSRDTEGLVRLTLNAYHDNVVRRPQSFAAMKDALTV